GGDRGAGVRGVPALPGGLHGGGVGRAAAGACPAPAVAGPERPPRLDGGPARARDHGGAAGAGAGLGRDPVGTRDHVLRLGPAPPPARGPARALARDAAAALSLAPWLPSFRRTGGLG